MMYITDFHSRKNFKTFKDTYAKILSKSATNPNPLGLG
jgi:hypothetical protein